MARKGWELDFLAEPDEVAALRRIMRLHLSMWGLPDLVEPAQLCVSELVANVIKHVGAGTPTTLALFMRDTSVRIEVRDPDGRALPTLLGAGPDAESGRGMALVDAMAERWGVEPVASGKTTWCELATDLSVPGGHAGGERTDNAEALLCLYEAGAVSAAEQAHRQPLSEKREESAIGLIADLLHWLRVHGRDTDEALDRARGRVAAQL